MYREILFNIALPIVGIGFIVFSMIWRRHLSGQKVVDLTMDKLGLILKADAFGLVVLLGFLMTSAGIFFLSKGYEDKLKTLQSEKNGLEQAIQQFKIYDMRLSLIFPENNPANPFKLTSSKVYVQKKGERATNTYELASFEQGQGGIVVNLPKLNFGDKLYVDIEEQGKKWRSDDMIAPAAHLKMHPSN
jgi:hypothetical protein